MVLVKRELEIMTSLNYKLFNKLLQKGKKNFSANLSKNTEDLSTY
jgi:hypothetical protein